MKGRCIHRQPFADGELQVWDEDAHRSLWFDEVILQSEIHREDPQVLPNLANRAMLAHLLFGQQPQRILLGGGGGGAIARWFAARAPDCAGDTVEISPEVAQLAHDFFDFPERASGWTLHIADIRDFVSHSPAERYDFILIDLEEQHYSPDWLSAPEFIQHCARLLRPEGVLTINLIPRDAAHYGQALRTIREAFAQHTLSLPVSGHDNQLIMAFQSPPSLQDIDSRIAAASKQWGLPFARYWQTLQQHNPPNSGIL